MGRQIVGGSVRGQPIRRRRRIAQVVRHGDGTPAAGFIRGPRPVSATASVTVSVAIMDYGSGTLQWTAKGCEGAAREEVVNEPIMVASDPEEVRRADRVV